MKHLFVSLSMKQDLFVSAFIHKCLMMSNGFEYTTFKMFVTQMSNYFLVRFYRQMFDCQHCSQSYRMIEDF